MSKESLVESALDRAPDLARKLVWAETPAQLIKITVLTIFGHVTRSDSIIFFGHLDNPPNIYFSSWTKLIQVKPVFLIM